MNFLSTKQLAERWGISPRRVVVLASQGRIDGAVQIDGRWFIPQDAEKPLPPTSRKGAPETEKHVRYVFPFLLGCVHSEAQIDAFTDEEHALYELCLIYESGDFAQARTRAEALLASQNPYIRIGALYHLPTICMYLGDYASTDKYTLLFRTACHSCKEHKAELRFLLNGFDSEMVSVSDFAKGLNTTDLSTLPDELMPLVSSWVLFAEVASMGRDGTLPDCTAHELSCRMIEAQGFFFDAMYMHLYLSLYYGATGEPEQERRHIKRAIDIGSEHSTVFTLAYSMTFNLEAANEVLRDYPPELAERLKSLSAVFLTARSEYAEHRGQTAVPTSLKDEDYALLSLCLKNFTIGKMAESLGISSSAVNKRLNRLYTKLGVRSKHELTLAYLDSVMNWGWQ